MTRLSRLLAGTSLVLSLVPAAQAVSLGQIDTFDTTLDGWSAGGGPIGSVPPVPPQRIAGGGPGGALDSYMQVTASGGAGPGSKLVVMNVLGSWAGDYLAAGVGAIAMDLRNLGTTDLTMRLLFEDPIPNPPANEAVTSTSFTLAAGSGWTHVLFPIGPAALVAQTGDASTALMGTTVLRLFHSTAAAFPGEAVAGVLGVDNIQAVPEAQTWSMMLAGMGLLGWWAVRRRPR